ncbi:MAG: 3D-(3,5/4)-trihydroxycyclohexane-1,2-dione acylhydrolase (decyclizing) [Paenibacillus sp.]|uniref:3D-(3,5/4)-trihydroxycyclohexane-1,2-dione acylhydrolase (decyclizing) n=1 Tax=Paenibacillus sp. TaxID=58172 RepID=UPI002914684D|nr:3D-(3,5/4)-trihydroxycyclohexane-1,2-dione acylhydrolase (decyclizing) [Paenibacillus sp.]MDU4696123.1 3D-(3,5/4)-trihydroxycyclohexane-1,2-dione acylhydrolase (decyclizing) [Paenibacillus sp.]
MKETVRLTMAQALLHFLDNQYLLLDGKETKFVEGIIGIFGHGNVTGIGEAIEREKTGLTFIQGKNEQGMVHTAVAYAKQKARREIFACTTSIGPGALNMVTAAATATVNRIPVLLLPGDNFACRQPDPVSQQLEVPNDYTISAVDAFRPVSRYWDRISRPEQLMSAALQAMRVLTDPAETGAVTLALPQDVQTEVYDYPVEFLRKRIHVIDRRPPAKDAIERAAALIAGKQRPLIIAGGGVHYSGATAELLAFAEAFGIPVAETQAGKSAISWKHPLGMGGVGVTGTATANRLAREADVIIGVGTRYNDFTTASKSAFGENTSFVNLNVNGQDVVKQGGVSVAADAREGLAALRAALLDRAYRSGYDAAELAGLKADWDQEVERLFTMDLQEGLAQTRALGVINRYLGEEDIVLLASGSLPGDMHRLWRTERPGTYHAEYGFSCMGYEVSGALGAALAEPDRHVYAVLGDGGYLMLHSELVTSLQENRKITLLLFDNHGYQCIHSLQRSQGSDGFVNEFRRRDAAGGGLTGAYLPIDFAAHARSMGAKAYTATTAEELQEALIQAKQEPCTTLIDIKVVPGSHTDGYDSWWRVGVPEVSSSPKVVEAHQAMRQRIERARPL